MKATRDTVGLRRPVHRGSVLARGFWFDGALVPEPVARRRILAAWCAGAAVYRLGGGLVLVLPQATRVRAEAAPGHALVGAPDLLLGAPLDPARLPAGEAGARVALVRGGRLVVEALPAREEDPATWIALDGFALLPLLPLGEPPSPVAAVLPALPVREARELLGAAVPPPDARRAEVLQALRAAVAAGGAGGAGGGSAVAGGASAPARNGGLRSRLRTAGALLGWLAGQVRAALFSRGGRAPAAGGALVAPPPAPPPGRFWPRLLRVLSWLRVTRVLGQRQAAYLLRMMDLFERGDLDQALRLAIPLEDMRRPLTTPPRPALGVPAPRTALVPTPHASSAATSMLIATEPFEHLRGLYRAAFNRLDRAGRIEEAAFVLADLLRADEEAVAYLERKDRLRLAAELAEGRGLPPGLIVRQWFVAGDPARAVRVARAQGAFFDAVVRLQRTHPEHAAKLRLSWADLLAGAGDYAAAVEVAWQLAPARRLVLAWIDRGIALGEAQLPTLLARKASVVGAEAWEDVAGQAGPLLEATGQHALASLRALLAHLAANPRNAVTLALIKAGARALLRAEGRGEASVDAEEMRRHLGRGADDPLRVDLPEWKAAPAVALVERAPALEHVLVARGTTAAADAAFLPSGRVLVALGEAGVRLYGARGDLLHHFDEPAHALAVSDHGDRAFALARRGRVARIARLELGSRRAVYLRDLPLDLWARDHDGSTWFVAHEGAVMALDLLGDELGRRWRVGDLGGVLALERSSDKLEIVAHEWEIERLSYELPALTLRARKPVPLARVPLPGEALAPPRARIAHEVLAVGVAPEEPVVACQIDRERSWLMLSAGGGAEAERTVRFAADAQLARPRPASAPAGGDPPLVLGAGCAALALPVTGGVEVIVVDCARLFVRARLALPGAGQVALRRQRDSVAIADDRGRVALCDLRTGALVRALTV